MNEPEDNEANDDASGKDDDGEQSPSHGDGSSSPTPHIEHSDIQYVQLPLPKNQGRNDPTRIAKAEAVAAIIVRAQWATLASVYTFAF